MVVKHINEVFEEGEFEFVKKAKDKINSSWHDFIVLSANIIMGKVELKTVIDSCSKDVVKVNDIKNEQEDKKMVEEEIEKEEEEIEKEEEEETEEEKEKEEEDEEEEFVEL